MKKELMNVDYDTLLERNKKSHRRCFWIFTIIMVAAPLLLTWFELGRNILTLFGFFNGTIVILFNVWFVSFDNRGELSADAIIKRLKPNDKVNMGNYDQILKQRNELLSRIAPPKSARLWVAFVAGLAVVSIEWGFAILQSKLPGVIYSNIISGIANFIALLVALWGWKKIEDERKIYYFFMKNGADPVNLYNDIDKRLKNKGKNKI